MITRVADSPAREPEHGPWERTSAGVFHTPPIPLRCTPVDLEGTVVVLGASYEQCSMIRVIQQKGLRALALDANPQSVGFLAADDHAVVSNRDVAAIVDYCRAYHRRYRILGITTLGSDIPHILAGVGAALDLPAVSVETGQLATHKYLMKERFRQCGIPIPWFDYVSSPAELRRIARERDYEIIIKPVDASGSHGVFHPRPEDDLDELFARAADAGSAGRVMVEEYLPGPQVSTQSVILDDTSYTPAVAYRNYDHPERFQPQIMQTGAEHPGDFSDDITAACAELTVRAGRALGITRGTTKGDLVIHPERGPMVIEIAARLSAGDFTDALIPVSTGVNFLDAIVNLAIDQQPNAETLTPDQNKVAMSRYFFPEPGTLKTITGIDAAIERPWLRRLRTMVQPGDRVGNPAHHGVRVGAFIVEGETHQQAQERVAEIHHLVRFGTT